MTANETLRLIAKQWCNLSDLMKLAGVGRNTALNIKNSIKQKLEQEECSVPTITALLGHATPTETLDTYSHMFEETLEGVTDYFDKIYEENMKKNPPKIGE